MEIEACQAREPVLLLPIVPASSSECPATTSSPEDLTTAAALSALSASSRTANSTPGFFPRTTTATARRRPCRPPPLPSGSTTVSPRLGALPVGVSAGHAQGRRLLRRPTPAAHAPALLLLQKSLRGQEEAEAVEVRLPHRHLTPTAQAEEEAAAWRTAVARAANVPGLVVADIVPLLSAGVVLLFPRGR
ncbi:hypothetical protein Cni_G20103 [Canna indica]|uniref:Uncharacterized protein n=1 Tax=Canna indica TaxID=4628 RepID=A0AAQ3QJ57_9LILI|nr:hypothetical protein Cni_G20103 [Canna indica]